MKEIIKATGAGIAILAVIVIVFITTVFLVEKTGKILHAISGTEPCKMVDGYMLEVDNGEDKYMGTDLQIAKELANGRVIYPSKRCI